MTILSNISNCCVSQFNIPITSTPIDRRLFIVPENNSIGDNRRIDPDTGDYSFGSNGKIEGLVGIQQQVYLSLLTVLGSSASINLGSTINNIQVIGTNINQDITNSINLALAPLIAANQISLNNVSIIPANTTTGFVVNVDWTDLTQTQSQLNNLQIGSGNVISSYTIYNCSLSRGISPREISFCEADYRADRGIVAQYGLVSQWWNECGASEDGGPPFDMGRNAIQNTIANQPRFNASDGYLNFQPSITFSSNQWLQTGIWTDGYIDGYTTIFMVGYWKDNNATYNAFDGYGSNSYTLENVSGTLKFNAGSTATGGSTNGNASAWIIVLKPGNNNSYYRQNSNATTTFTGSIGNNVPLGFTIGNSLAGNNGGITLGQISVMNGELSKYYQDALMQYAKNRFNIGIV